jgi:2-oxoglutarate ferredoxin oxidoreductase subunit beta
MSVQDKLKTDLFPTIWCPGCGIGLIMAQLAAVMDELGLDKNNTVIVTGIGCTGRMGAYMNFESVYTLHGRTIPVAEAIKIVRPELHVIVCSGDGDIASIGGNHLLHAIRRNANITVLCNNNEIYGLTGGQAGPTTPKGTSTISTPDGAAYSPLNLQGVVNTNPSAYYARTTVYHQGPMKKAIREALEWPGFSFVEIASQCIENNGRRIGFSSAYEMLQYYRTEYKSAPPGATRLEPNQIGIVRGEPLPAAGDSGDGSAG